MFAAVWATEPGGTEPGGTAARSAAAGDTAASSTAAGAAGPGAALEDVARDFSPRIERCGDREVVLDVHGLDRLIGDPPTIAAELRRAAAERGLHVRVAIAAARTAARLLVHAQPALHPTAHNTRGGDPGLHPTAHITRGGGPGLHSTAHNTRGGDPGATVVDPGDERRALAPLPIDLLAFVVDEPDLVTLRRWGLRTLGDLAGLPDAAVAARLGQAGVAWQKLARGEDPRPLVPALPEERFEQALDLEWPIEEIEPLSFVLGRLLEPLSAHLERRDRGAAVLHVRLHLITREVHERSLELPAPIRDARTLRTLALLDLESHPPAAAIDRVMVAVDPTPGRVVQFSLLTRPLPSPEQLSTLMARLAALMGEGRCGSPQDVDSWAPGAFAMRRFAPRDPATVGPGNWQSGSDPQPRAALRRFRHPVPIRVRFEAGAPARVTTDRRGLAGGRVTTCAGPWRTSGAWWDSAVWNRDEWDVTLQAGETCRIFHDRESDRWFLDGIVD